MTFISHSTSSCSGTQPVVGQAHAGTTQRGQHAAATVVTHHQNVLDLEEIDRVLDHRQRIQIRVHHHIGHVAVHEHLARVQTGDLVGRHPAVGAADPQVFGVLLVGQPREEPGLLALHARGPGPVVVEKVLK
jgi:hypothetical protein